MRVLLGLLPVSAHAADVAATGAMPDALLPPPTPLTAAQSLYLEVTLNQAPRGLLPFIEQHGRLQALPQVTQTDTFTSGTASQTHTHTGSTLWSVVNAAGIQTTPGVKNDLLDRYVLATGSDGYRVVFSMGELSPAFGNRADLVATQETIAGKTAPLAADGLARQVGGGVPRRTRQRQGLRGVQFFPVVGIVGARVAP